MTRNRSVALMVVLLAAVIFPQAASQAGLWKTEAQLNAEYGEPVEIRRNFSERMFTYEGDGLKIEVQFRNGVSHSIRYTHPNESTRFVLQEFESLLAVSANGKVWQRKDQDTYQLGNPPLATAQIGCRETITYRPGADKVFGEEHFVAVNTVAFAQAEETRKEFYEPLGTVRRLIVQDLLSLPGGMKKRFEGVLEFRSEQNDSQVAIIRDAAFVLEIPWTWRGYGEKAKLEAGRTYAITIRDDDGVDLDSPTVFVSDRVHKSHGDRVIDSESFTLIRVSEGDQVLYDESVCEVHKTPMQRQEAMVEYGMVGWTVCDRMFPHHRDWIPGGCVDGSVKSAFHFVCAKCVADAAKCRSEHPMEGSE